MSCTKVIIFCLELYLLIAFSSSSVTLLHSLHPHIFDLLHLYLHLHFHLNLSLLLVSSSLKPLHLLLTLSKSQAQSIVVTVEGGVSFQGSLASSFFSQIHVVNVTSCHMSRLLI